ncbi:uncharacterized protein K460DRAFT_405710 [Cucurbitaria berberidis CBS 394.84]|uniref:Uncharacterized protein n=1 Tax=Cucurbitaria berberidis CBS 394.84 TaxID=1168544 RepID=A0A9P4L7X9_9PLEO|nr:uncharacterized protein K460DRAFT_405710 [Cucurbitaria berberidis CBS 394.84]KAF1845451.1 hypothetical protein K460DRAFT_405710 [Cucurbitaria berberidis CBS 394.84]
MKLSAFISIYSASLVIAGFLDVRQDGCRQDDCYRALWGTDLGSEHPFVAYADCQQHLTTTTFYRPITTVTTVTKTTTTTTTPCPTIPTTTIILLPPGPTITLSAEVMKKVKARQALPTEWFTTTTRGPFPPYATDRWIPSVAWFYDNCHHSNYNHGYFDDWHTLRNFPRHLVTHILRSGDYTHDNLSNK